MPILAEGWAFIDSLTNSGLYFHVVLNRAWMKYDDIRVTNEVDCFESEEIRNAVNLHRGDYAGVVSRNTRYAVNIYYLYPLRKNISCVGEKIEDTAKSIHLGLRLCRSVAEFASGAGRSSRYLIEFIQALRE